MISHQVLRLLCLISILGCAAGCGSGEKDPVGVTEEQLKKSMESAPGSEDAGPRILETTAEETISPLADPMAAEVAREALAAGPRRITGKILELSSADASPAYVVLDGGNHGGKAYKIKCILAKNQSGALKTLKAGAETKVEGTSDGVLKENTLEFKDCVLASESNP